MTSTQIFEGFSVSHAAILDPTTGLDILTGNLFGVRDASVVPTINQFDNTGDDFVLSTWYWLDYAEVTVQGGYVPFSTIAYLSGSTVTSSGTGVNDYYSLPLWQADIVNQPRRPMLVRIPSKDSAGTVRDMDFILYNVQFAPFSFTGPSYKNGLVLNYSGRALISSTDEMGNVLAKKAIGRLISRPQGTTTRF